nr:hypothetical protein [Bacteroides thetaiotaomicron]
MHGTQTVSDGQALRIHLATDGWTISVFKGTVLVGGTCQGGTDGVLIETVEWGARCSRWNSEVLGLTGSRESWPELDGYDAAREIAAGMGHLYRKQHQYLNGCRSADCFGCGQGGDTGCHNMWAEDAHTVKVP